MHLNSKLYGLSVRFHLNSQETIITFDILRKTDTSIIKSNDH
jgi:hypothetical protein